jgi:hypothetical protein
VLASKPPLKKMLAAQLQLMREKDEKDGRHKGSKRLQRKMSQSEVR